MQRIPNGALDILLNLDSTSNVAKTPAGGWKTGADAGHVTDWSKESEHLYITDSLHSLKKYFFNLINMKKESFVTKYYQAWTWVNICQEDHPWDPWLPPPPLLTSALCHCAPVSGLARTELWCSLSQVSRTSHCSLLDWPRCNVAWPQHSHRQAFAPGSWLVQPLDPRLPLVPAAAASQLKDFQAKPVKTKPRLCSDL